MVNETIGIIDNLNNERVATLKEDICEDCGKPWNSEYHLSDQCVNINEDKEVEAVKEFEKVGFDNMRCVKISSEEEAQENFCN